MSGSAIAAALFCALCVLLCFLAAMRADRRFARFDRIPWQFGLAGAPTSFGPRRAFFFLMPWLGVALLVLMGLSLVFLPATGSPAVAFVAVGLITLAIELLLIHLIERWARTQA